MSAPRPRLLDLFCGAGGSAMGYFRAGFEVVGVDIAPQPQYPFEFHQADAMTYPLDGFDFIHASPPCQGYSIMRNLPWLRDKEYPLLIEPVRERLVASGLPFAIENVAGAQRVLQAGWLCGQMFGLPFFRHRLFATNWPWLAPAHPRHAGTIRPGRQDGARAREIAVKHDSLAARQRGSGTQKRGVGVGHAAGWDIAAKAMGIDWMKRDGLSQAIPPIFTEWLSRRWLEQQR